MLDTIIETLKANHNLTEEVKANLLELITRFTGDYPDFSLDELNTRLKSLNYITVSKYASNDSIDYDVNKNQFVFNESLLSKEEDVRFLLMQSLLDLMTKKNTPDNESLKGFRQGFKGLVASSLVGNESEVNKSYANMVSVNLLGHILTPIALNKLFIEYDIEIISKELHENSISNKDFADLLDKMSYNATAKDNSVDTQYMIAKMFLNKTRSSKAISDFYFSCDSEVAKTLLQSYAEQDVMETGKTL